MANETVETLCNAARARDLDRVREIIAAEPRLAYQEVADNNEHQAIHFAAEAGNAEVVAILLEAGADPLQGIYPHRDATTALRLTSDRGHTAVVETIEAWLNKKRGTTSRGEEFVQLVASGDIESVQATLDKRPSLVKAKDRNGQTGLFKAIHHGDMRTVIELLDRGANPNHADSGRCRPIHRCLHHNWKVPESMYGTYAAIAGVLIARGAAYNIWVASGVGDVNGIKAMLRAEPNPNRLLRNRSPYVHDYVNPLWVACFHGHTDVVRLLLDAGADPDSPFTINVAGETVKQWGHTLWIAANQNHYEVVKLLLEAGANPNAAVYASGSALSNANLRGYKETAELLYRYGATDDLLSYCVTNNLAAIVEIMHREPSAYSEASGDTRDPWESLLWSGVLAGNINVVAMCLRRNPQFSHEAWFNLLEQSIRGWRLGDLKINNADFDRRNYITILRMLLAHGVDPNLRNGRSGSFNFTILHHLAGKSCDPAQYGHTPEEIVEFASLFLDHGAVINALENKLQSTPLGWAARFGNIVLVKYFLERGADPHLAGENWATPLAWTEREGHVDIVEILDNM